MCVVEFTVKCFLQSPSTTPSTGVGESVASLEPAARRALLPSHEGEKIRKEEEQEKQRLTSELQEIERERLAGVVTYVYTEASAWRKIMYGSAEGSSFSPII